MQVLVKTTMCWLVFLSCMAAVAGGMDSGGGHGVVCFAASEEAALVKNSLGYIPNQLIGKIQSVEFLDYHYAKFPVGMHADSAVLLEDSGFATGIDLYYFLKNRLQQTLPELYEILDLSERQFNKIGISWAPIGVKPLLDTGLLSTITDDRCALVLMAYQEPVGSHFYLQVDDRLYNHPAHTKLSQASLFLHEFLYLHARKSGEVDSSSVLAIVRLLLHQDLDVEKIRAISTKIRLFSLAQAEF